MIRSLISIAIFLSAQLAVSQSTENLKEGKHLYLHGNSILIGNNILGHHSTEPMTDDDVPNDAVKMRYIDVDNDKSTFSSSQASVVNAPENSKIVYAALYWSALYPYKKSSIRVRNNEAQFIGKGDRDPDINHILFQIPGSDYTSIEGEILKDEHENKAFSNVSPYVCRADVTHLLQELGNINGVYTVANVKATEGNISGGGSAGWLLYVVYEDLNESLKYFTTYDGLIQIDRETVDVRFSKFKSNQKGKINPTLGIAALEGDRKIRTDQMLLYSPKTGEFIPMGNSLRSERNFFNSSITMGNQLFKDRNPNSSNTLGFDLLKLDIPNENNQFFDENTSEATLRFQTRADRFFLFFVSFEIDMDRDYLDSLNSDLIASGRESFKTNIESNDKLKKSQLPQELASRQDYEKSEWNIAQVSFEENSESENQKLAGSRTANNVYPETNGTGNSHIPSDKTEPQPETPEINETASSHISSQKTEAQPETPETEIGEITILNGVRKTRYPNLSESEKLLLFEEIASQDNRVIPGESVGYYLVTNVFAVPDNARRWREFLINKKFTPSTFVNPENNWEYIYIDSFSDLEDGFEAWLNHQDKEYFVGLWLMKVNWHTGEISVLL